MYNTATLTQDQYDTGLGGAYDKLYMRPEGPI
jgi:hypothetical protein